MTATDLRDNVLAPADCALVALKADLAEIQSRARMHWRTCRSQRFTGRFCRACAEWDAEELAAERLLKRAEREARR